MKKLFSISLFVVLSTVIQAQTYHEYYISFDNAVHHEATIEVTFSNLDDGPLEVQMSRTSPGRYAIHNFAKNVYGVQAFDENGIPLEIHRPNPQQWDVSGHNGTVVFKYTLFANRGDGTYSQINEDHAHLNIPATFVYARNYMHRPVRIDFDVREDLNWQVATQLVREGLNTYTAPDGYYFMDSPVLLADYHLREEMIDGQLIRLALHTEANDNEVNDYFSKVLDIVRVQRDIFGELPDFDFGEYTFICNYTPSASRDGMEHRNSTIVSGTKEVEEPLGEFRLSTISHEFIHVWNVERLRPASLEPFDFEEANMSGELWFAEGFTSYYTGLAMVRAEITSEEDYINGLANAINRVFNAPGLQFFNPIEMSYRAPFVDAATSIDPTNNINTFASYYTYGSVLGLALDLSLRTLGENKSLDEYMRLLWRTYGKSEVPYSIRDLEDALVMYTSEEFASSFFNNFIYESGMPNFDYLFNQVGVDFGIAAPNEAYLGNSIIEQDGSWKLSGNALIGTPLYEAGIESTDEIISIAGVRLSNNTTVEEILRSRRPGQTISVIYKRWGEEMSARVTLERNPAYATQLSRRTSREARSMRSAWLNGD